MATLKTADSAYGCKMNYFTYVATYSKYIILHTLVESAVCNVAIYYKERMSILFNFLNCIT